MSTPSSTLLAAEAKSVMLVTMRLGAQRFGIPDQHVRDALKDQKIAPIPKAPPEVAGSLNLRGRIVTVIDLRQRLGVPGAYSAAPMFIVVDFKGEYFSLLVDAVGEVMTIPTASIEPNPSNLSLHWREVAEGVCLLKEDLLVILDIHALLET